LLFGKDSANRANFGIKTYDKDGKELHNLEHVVEAEFVEPDCKLRRTYKEKYVTKKGAIEPVFDGHVTEYQINGKSASETEYKQFINSIISEELFKLLSDPLYFNVSMKWEDRRKALFDICPISDNDIIQTSPALFELQNIEMSVVDFENTVKEKLKITDKKLQEYRPRIEELQKSIQDTETIDISELQESLKALNINKTTKLEEKALINAGGDNATINIEIAKIDAKIINLTNEFNMKQNTKFSTNEKSLAILQSLIDIETRKVEQIDNAIKSMSQSISEKTFTRDEMRKTCKSVIDEVFETSPNSGICPTCSQILSEELQKSTLEKAFADFNLKKSESVEAITKNGIKVNVEIEELKKSLLDAESDKEHSLKLIVAKQAEIEQLKTNKPEPKLEELPEYIDLLQQKTELQKQTETNQTTSDNTMQLDIINNSIVVIDSEIATINAMIAKHDAASDTKVRIDTLKAGQKELAAQYAELSKQKELCEIFTRTKTEMVENTVNSMFQLTKWKLFNVLVNGEVKECCESTFNGVPYSDLNKAQTINTGLDIINTLSKYYNVSVPIFIDNAESVVKLADCDAQIIRLVVSDFDSKLRMEIVT
jgi:hypothetical protein